MTVVVCLAGGREIWIFGRVQCTYQGAQQHGSGYMRGDGQGGYFRSAQRTPAPSRSTCHTSRGRWWKPTQVGGQEGTMSRLCVKRQLACAARMHAAFSIRMHAALVIRVHAALQSACMPHV